MTVIALQTYREPAPRLLTLFCAQAYWNDRGKLAQGRSEHFANLEMAMRAAKRMERRAPAVMVYRVRGNPEADYWEAPVTVAKFGDRASEL